MCIRMIFCFCFFFFKQKTAYEMRISDWSSDVCSSDLLALGDILLGDACQRTSVDDVDAVHLLDRVTRADGFGEVIAGVEEEYVDARMHLCGKDRKSVV